MKYWISFYNLVPLNRFELHRPWWVSGYDSDDHEIICAAVIADSEEQAWDAISFAYDIEVRQGAYAERFIEECPEDWTPFNGRFPAKPWMLECWPVAATPDAHSTEGRDG